MFWWIKFELDSESGIDEDTFDRIMEYADMDDDDRDAFDEFYFSNGYVFRR